MTQPQPPHCEATESRVALVWTSASSRGARGAVAGILAGWVHCVLEAGGLHLRWGSPFAGLDQQILFWLAVAALQTVAGALLGGALGTLWGVLREVLPQRRWAGAATAVAACAPLWVLNRSLMTRAPVACWLVGTLGTLGAALLAAIAADRLSPCPDHATRSPATFERWRWGAKALLPVLAVGALVTNHRVLPGLYPLQHASLSLASLGATGAWIWGILPWARPPSGAGPARRKGSLRVAALLLTAMTSILWVQSFVVLSDALLPSTRMVLARATLSTSHWLEGLESVLDRDGDGFSAFLGGPDCDDGDPGTSPLAVDLPDDGRDQDCLGGDLRSADVRDLRAQMRRGLPADRALPESPPSLILVTVDALRYDAAGSMQSFAWMAARGTTFARAYAPFPGTIPSMYSMATGRVPSALNLQPYDKLDVPSADRSRTLAEQARDRGYRTRGFFYYHAFRPGLGLSRGFTEVWTPPPDGDEQDNGLSTERMVDMGIAAVSDAQRTRQPLLLWMHLFDPHDPYLGDPARPPAPTDGPKARYLGELAYVDRHLLRFLHAVEQTGASKRSVLVLTADHGEAFGEHERWYHGSDLHEEQVHVPLVVALPGHPRPRQEGAPVSLAGLPATLAELAGLPPLPDAQIPSFAGLVTGDASAAAPPPPVFMEVFGREQPRKEAAIAWPWKLIHDVDRHAFSLTSLAQDPAEHHNLADVQPDRTAAMQRLLGTYRGLARSP